MVPLKLFSLNIFSFICSFLLSRRRYHPMPHMAFSGPAAGKRRGPIWMWPAAVAEIDQTCLCLAKEGLLKREEWLWFFQGGDEICSNIPAVIKVSFQIFKSDVRLFDHLIKAVKLSAEFQKRHWRRKTEQSVSLEAQNQCQMHKRKRVCTAKRWIHLWTERFPGEENMIIQSYGQISVQCHHTGTCSTRRQKTVLIPVCLAELSSWTDLNKRLTAWLKMQNPHLSCKKLSLITTHRT